MNFRSVIVGILATASLLAVLGFARVFSQRAVTPELTIRQVDTIEIPPPPPPIEEPLPDTPPPPVALTQLSSIPDMTRVAIPEVEIPLDFKTPVENFYVDAAPSALPAPPRVVTAPVSKPRVKTQIKTRPRPAKIKSHYAPSELDGRPRLIRRGPASFPRSLARKGVKRGTVVLEVELNTNGSVSVRRVISSTHSELIAPARRAASGSRYTSPKKNGQAVKAIMQLPVVIQK